MKILSGSSSNFAPKWFLNLIICSSTSPQQQAVSYGFGNGGTESPSEAWLATWWQFWTHIYSLHQFWGVAARVKKSHQDYKEVKLDHHLLLCTNQDKRPHGDKKKKKCYQAWSFLHNFHHCIGAEILNQDFKSPQRATLAVMKYNTCK